MSKEMGEQIDRAWKQFLNESLKDKNNEYYKAIEDVKVLIPLVSHDIIDEKGLKHFEPVINQIRETDPSLSEEKIIDELVIKLNSEIRQKVEQGDDDILDRMWDKAGSLVLKHAINVITHYHENKNN